MWGLRDGTDAGVADLEALLIAHRAPVRRLDLELMARATFPVATPIVLANTSAEAYLALDGQAIAVALLEETADFIRFAEHAVDRRPGLVVGWIPTNGAADPPRIGERLNAPIVVADIARLAARAAPAGKP